MNGNYLPWFGGIDEEDFGDGKVLALVVGYEVSSLEEGATEGVLGVILSAADGKVVCGLIRRVRVVGIAGFEVERCVWEPNSYCRAGLAVVAKLESQPGIEVV